MRASFVIALSGLALIGGTRPARAAVPGECVTPVAQRPGEMGCYLLATQAVPVPPTGPVYWHIYRFRTRTAAEAARRGRETVVEAFGRFWLFEIGGRQGSVRRGRRVASIGPLVLPRARAYTARFLEAVSVPGMRSAIHRHSGPEAWYMVSGAQCLATSHGPKTVTAGHGSVVGTGPMMQLVTIGKTKRRALVLVLHDAAQPWVTRVNWKPRGQCS